MRRCIQCGLGFALLLGAVTGWAANAPPSTAELRSWIEAMKRSPRGPFEGIRWFCRDGAVLPPTPGACTPRGGGVQHGLWSERTRILRGGGYQIANVLADLDPEPLLGRGATTDPLAWILLERFLVSHDDGWILRGARSYRGAFQAEDEEAGARRLLQALAADPAWLAPPRYLLLREAARLLPGRIDEASAQSVRSQASALAEEARAFAPLRNKIHALPDPEDVSRVRGFCATESRAAVRDRCLALADELEQLYRPERAARDLARIARRLEGTPAAAVTVEARSRLQADVPPEVRLRAAATGLAELRRLDAQLPRPGPRLAALEASLLLEESAFAAANELGATRATRTRRERLELLSPLAAALTGAGLLSGRQREALEAALARLAGEERLSLRRYRAELRYLERVPSWALRNLDFHFGLVSERLAALEPLATLFTQDRLRGSPLLAFSNLLDDLLLDANALAEVRHGLFDREVGTGLRALNGGLARGVLVLPAAGADLDRLGRDAIVLLENTVADLPPVAGILTRGEGSSLSHEQLLARNLGIPNVVVSEALVPELSAHAGERVVLAVSPEGVVELAREGPRTAAVFGREAPDEGLRIRPDLARLDLSDARIRPLASLRAADSGRIVGPKAANLAELARLWPSRVSRGVVIPFGAFRRLLEQPLEQEGPPVFRWMGEQYAAIALVEDRREARDESVAAFLARLRDWITTADPGPEFRSELRTRMTEVFGADPLPGVFVRSDTNVEDLPGFTGAGLNLTVPHVVGFDAVLEALGRVWASPFTERAYAWRQALMERPAYVFPAVLLLESVPAEKSGVLVTADVESGDPAWLSIAVGEGVGGAVEGQAAEELRVHRSTGEVRLLAQATAPRKAVLRPEGGVALVPASGAEALLAPAEVERLRALAEEVRERFPRLRDDAGRAVPADVEFGFVEGRLMLFQIRPFVESRRARRSLYLRELDAGIVQAGRRRVKLDAGVAP